MSVDGASAFEDTLARLRQRYALHFYWPEGPSNPEERLVTVALARSTGSEYPNAEVRYRRAYITKQHGRASGSLAEVSREADATDPDAKTSRPDNHNQSGASSTGQTGLKRRVAVNDDSGGMAGPSLIHDDAASDAPPTPGAQDTSAQNSSTNQSTQSPPPAKHGWPRVQDHPQQ